MKARALPPPAVKATPPPRLCDQMHQSLLAAERPLSRRRPREAGRMPSAAWLRPPAGSPSTLSVWWIDEAWRRAGVFDWLLFPPTAASAFNSSVQDAATTFPHSWVSETRLKWVAARGSVRRRDVTEGVVQTKGFIRLKHRQQQDPQGNGQRPLMTSNPSTVNVYLIRSHLFDTFNLK